MSNVFLMILGGFEMFWGFCVQFFEKTYGFVFGL